MSSKVIDLDNIGFTKDVVFISERFLGDGNTYIWQQVDDFVWTEGFINGLAPFLDSDEAHLLWRVDMDLRTRELKMTDKEIEEFTIDLL